MKKIILFVMILTGLLQTVPAQEKKDSVKNLKNTFHVNISNPLIFDKSFVVGYERVLNPRRSFSVNVGTQSFPGTEDMGSDSAQVVKVKDGGGFNFSVDYRFYLAKENKYGAPRGVYIGPYYSFNQFKRENSWVVKSTNGGTPTQVNSELKLNVHTVGFELGYQFVFWDRLAIDLVLLGPGIGAYSFNGVLAGNLSQADREKLFDAINDALAEKFPGYSWVIDEGEFQKKGTDNSTRFGYRYMVQIGFRF